MNIDIFEDCQQLAQNFLATKERVNYYETKGIADPYPDYVSMLTALTDEEVN